MATARIDMRLDEEIKAKAEKASALLGLRSLTEYVVRLMDKDSTKVISEHSSMTVDKDIFDRFMNACEEAHAPNKALIEAKNYTDKQNIK